MRPTLGKEPAAEDANPVGYLSGDTGIGLAPFSYRLCVTPCLQTLRRLTIICLIRPAPARLMRFIRTSTPIRRPRLMGALICDDLRRRIRRLEVSFHHRRRAKAERAAKNNECEIPTHRRSSRTPQECTDRADMGVTAVTKQRFCLATMSALPPKSGHFRRL